MDAGKEFDWHWCLWIAGSGGVLPALKSLTLPYAPAKHLALGALDPNQIHLGEINNILRAIDIVCSQCTGQQWHKIRPSRQCIAGSDQIALLPLGAWA